ncbi:MULTISPECIES: hypothetical protein [Nitrosarchaeum]|uniref:hypothetical protein n=1 Tax=Nitrosarchaeum TaxID=1007082 RepID=UPI00064F2C4E|nr:MULTISPECIES: hypothetical protein [Nitrosarchaeum]QLH11293.1 hypothetical protein DSQ20_07315 [Nitrosarchaeum sp. AC2]
MIRTVLTLSSLEQEVGNISKSSYEQGRDNLDDSEINYLLKMTKHVLMKIREQIMEDYDDYR